MEVEYISRKAQLRNAWVLAFFAVLSVYGMYTTFIPSPTYAYYSQLVALLLTAVFSAFYYYEYFKKDSKLKKILGNISKVHLAILPLGPLVILFFSLVWGIPATLHHFFATNAEGTFKTHAPRYAYINTSASCKGAVEIDSVLIIKSRVCSVPESIYERISDGDTLTVHGKKSIFGFSYDPTTFGGNIDASLQKRT